ncbi:hypothetical protein D9X91_13860 [Falsibacillus albus]|uniref:Uncharacterized protein n=1 Tax=Falsibacillus albus TaxID=2478915 RepID=A0A3L7JWB9_9BACI|nr:hypothetical protein D9X91_13860 [Falsibacillus albus]
MINFLLRLFSAGTDQSLDTHKIDQNIERLQQYNWFQALYEDQKYHRQFFVNRKVREYLQSKPRVNKLINNEKARKKFLMLLEEQSR